MNTHQPAPQRARYHHGDLKNALLDASLEILERDGLGALTLRGVAARAGVSHAAPSHYFPTLTALMTALATIGFHRFDAAMREARTSAGPDPSSQLDAAGEGYFAFATSQPGLFRLMFTGDRLDWTDPDLQTASAPGRTQLTEIVAPAADALGITDPAERLRLEHLVWSTAHGYAHLAIEGELGPIKAAPKIGGLVLGAKREGE
jgi:AcrR family transcriptional regulator